jgi:flagellar basal body-associated protein FliL
MTTADRQADRQDNRKLLWITSTVLITALIAGALFAGWMNYSDTIFMTMLMDGVSWCF